MAVVAIGSVHGSPGTTTLAVDLAATASRFTGREALLIEADPDGGGLAARLDLAVRPGLTELAGAARVGIRADDLWKFAQPAHGIAVVCAHPAAEQVHAALRAASNHIASALTDLQHDAVVDIGRLRPGSPSLAMAAGADHVVVVSRNGVEAIVSLSHRAQMIRSLGPSLVALTSSKPYGAADIEAATGLDVWGTVPPSSGRRREATNRIDVLADLWAHLGRDDASTRDVSGASHISDEHLAEPLAEQPLVRS